MKINVQDIDYEEYYLTRIEDRTDPDFSKINFKLTIGKKIGLVYQDDKKYFDEFAYRDFETWSDYRNVMCNRAIVVPHENIHARGNLDPAEVILCFYDYPCEKQNPTTDFITLNKIMQNPDVYEVFEI